MLCWSNGNSSNEDFSGVKERSVKCMAVHSKASLDFATRISITFTRMEYGVWAGILVPT